MDEIIIDNSALSVLLAIHQPRSQGPNPGLGAGPGQRLWERGWHLPVSGPVHRGTLAQIFQFENATFSFRIQKFPDSLPNSPDTCRRKPYLERKCCEFKVWTGPHIVRAPVFSVITQTTQHDLPLWSFSHVKVLSCSVLLIPGLLGFFAIYFQIQSCNINLACFRLNNHLKPV